MTYTGSTEFHYLSELLYCHQTASPKIWPKLCIFDGSDVLMSRTKSFILLKESS